MPAAHVVAAGFSPLDEALELLSGSRFTPRLIEGMVLLSAHLPFGQVPAILAHFTGVAVDAETVRRLTEAAGAVQAARETAAVEAIERRLPTAPAGPARQVVSVDGVMVPVVGGRWMEARVLAIGALAEAPVAAGHAAGDGRATALSYFARLDDAETFTRLATVETHRRGTERAETVVGVVDGALWCQAFLDYQRHDAVRILDIAHALGYLGQVAQARYGPGTDDASAWLGAQAHALRHGGEEAVLTTLRDLAQAAGRVDVREAAETAYGYLAARQEQIRYARFRALGYPIGSGCVESANKLVVQARLAGSGMHWRPEAVNPMLALRCLAVNGRWQTEWPQLWQAWRGQHRQQVAARRAARTAAQTLAPLDSPATPTPAAPASPLPAPPTRAKTVVNGRPTAEHPWRRSSPFPTKQ
jgi:hypothetical protein